MLYECSIRNLAVIEALHVQCGRGFHVLTGETGAGKSIIIDALGLIAGGRGSSDLVRHGSDKAEIECSFDVPLDHPVWNVLEELGIEASSEEVLVIRREVSSQGKSTARINGQMVNLAMLKKVGEHLVNIHGQHEHQSLLKKEQHIFWLDAYGEQDIQVLYTKYQKTYSAYKALQQQLHDIKQMNKESLQMLDLYKFQIDEIEKAELTIGEDECLLEEKHKLTNAEKLFQATSQSYENLNGTERGLEWTSKAIELVEQVVSFDNPVFAPMLEQMKSAYYQLEDAAYQLRDYAEHIEFNPVRIDEIETRLDLISSFRRKYGDSIEEILQYLSKIKAEVEVIENKDERVEQLEKQVSEQHMKMKDLADKLTKARKKWAISLSSKIEAELKELHMERTRFEVQMKARSEFTADGQDEVEFMISPNPGEPLKPLSKIASGGEISRIMLALKSIFADVDRIPVLVFDEVDTGVSGRAAQAIAEKMSRLSKDCQVFSITHLPQVACMSDIHFEVSKKVDGSNTFTQLHQLNEQQRIKELARMLGGVEVTSTTEHHAKEMLAMAEQKKEQWNDLQL